MKCLFSLLIIAVVAFSFNAEAQRKSKSNGPENRNIIKFEFFSPMTGNLTLGYERFIPSKTFNMSYVNYIGIVGLGGATEYENRSGAFLKTGPKLFFSDTSLMDGLYFHPELFFGWHTIDDQVWFTDGSNGWPGYTTQEFLYGGLALGLGYQVLIKNVFAIDFYGAAGYGFSSNYYDEYMYSSIIFGDVPLSFTGGFSLGYLF